MPCIVLQNHIYCHAIEQLHGGITLGLAICMIYKAFTVWALFLLKENTSFKGLLVKNVTKVTKIHTILWKTVTILNLGYFYIVFTSIVGFYPQNDFYCLLLWHEEIICILCILTVGLCLCGWFSEKKCFWSV